ncbi:MAG: hypothetical protein DRR06_05450 [Gammaproteobacteria bacterium]|nr:MAG: hypothetical protein DRR06_05450 [Gammaproteobacteria bacterium]
MNITRHIAAILLIIAVPTIVTSTASADSVYREVDEKGRVTFTDKPSVTQPSEKIKLSPINTQPAVAIPLPDQPEEEGQPEGDETDVPYSVYRITQPTQEVTIPTGQMDVVVQLELKPSLQSGHLVTYYHNGVALGDPVATIWVTLTELIRGQHDIRAEVVDASGNIKAKTKTIVFYVQRYRPRLNRPARPTPR